MFTYADAHKQSPLEIHFTYLGNKDTYDIFKTCCILSVQLSTECRLYHNFIFLHSNNTYFFLKPYKKFKYQLGR